MKSIRAWRARAAWVERLKNPPNRPKKPYSSGKNAQILLLVDQDDTDTTKKVSSFAKDLEKKGAIVTILKRTEQKDIEPQQLLWSSGSYGFNRLPTSDAEAPILSKEYDIAIHCSLTAFDPFDYLMAAVVAHRKICAYAEKEDVYNLIINVPPTSSIKLFLEQVSHFNKIISA